MVEGGSLDKWIAAYEVMRQVGDRSQEGIRRQKVKGRAAMIRRYGEAVRPGIRYRPRPGVYAILALGNSVLLTHQAEPIPEFQLPVGGSDPVKQRLANFKISVDRSSAVARSLTDSGVPAGIVEVDAVSDNAPLLEGGEAADRRVEIYLN